MRVCVRACVCGMQLTKSKDDTKALNLVKCSTCFDMSVASTMSIMADRMVR